MKFFFSLLLACIIAGTAGAQIIYYNPLPPKAADMHLLNTQGYHVRLTGAEDHTGFHAAFIDSLDASGVHYSTTSRDWNEEGDTVIRDVTRYYFDAAGNLTRTVLVATAKPHEQRIKSYTYDAKGRVLTDKEEYGDTITHVFTYDAAGRVKEMAEYSSTKESFVPQKLGSLNLTDHHTFTYDAKGRMIMETDKSVNPELIARGPYIYTWEYDAAGRISRCTGHFGQNSIITSSDYTYDKNGLLTSSSDWSNAGTTTSIYVYR